MPEEVKIVIVDGTLYAQRKDGTLLNILVDVFDCPVYGKLKVVCDKDGAERYNISR